MGRGRPTARRRVGTAEDVGTARRAPKLNDELTPLQVASLFGQTGASRRLLAKGADVSITNDQGARVSVQTLSKEVDRHAKEFMEKYPRAAFPELKEHPVSDPNVFEKWAKESREMEKEFGTIEKYFSEGLGINAAQQESLRRLYLRTE